ncbi:hypothetical protein Acj9p209 [Acinetobacter phage Acj9]|uniref:Uncharacterized protein n=1 Tax=Acinetobacter phage Acj9 TaxID=760939 RepID=E5EPZ3_9CAUD|nr:hypothetical protein Acj9p209 [Acinetobacter phage Acj9]ADG60109.1 hypothetical protein Acj9p209 [Acinetobacter phage Acj9]
MSNYVSIQELDLENAHVVGLDRCIIEVVGESLVCYNEFEMIEAQYPIDLNSQYRISRGLPPQVGLLNGLPVPYEVDEDDENYFEDDTPVEILEEYSYVTTMHFTLVIRNEQ